MIKYIKIRLFGKRYNVWKDEIDFTNKEGYYIYNNTIYYVTGFLVFFVSHKKKCMSKITAVEWVIDEIEQMEKILDNLIKNDVSLKKDVDAVFTATTLLKMKCIIAKEMEKEQIIEAHGAKQYHKSVNGEQYYNETYKKEDK